MPRTNLTRIDGSGIVSVVEPTTFAEYFQGSTVHSMPSDQSPAFSFLVNKQAPADFRQLLNTAPLGDAEASVQEWFDNKGSQLVDALGKVASSYWKDSHNRVAYKTRKPDGIHLRFYADRKRATVDVLNVVAISEFKKRRKGQSNTFSDEEEGHCASLLRDLVMAQQRPSKKAYAYLTDGVFIEFLMVELQKGEKDQIYKSETMRFDGRGADLLYAFYTASYVELGYSCPDIKFITSDEMEQEVSLLTTLGTGSSASVFTGSVKYDGTRDGQLAVKWFRDAGRCAVEEAKYEDLLEFQESSTATDEEFKLHAGRNDRKLPDTVCLSEVYAKSVDGRALLLVPIGTPFALTSAEMLVAAQASIAGKAAYNQPFDISNFRALLDFLVWLGKAGKVHRDIKLSNLLRHGEKVHVSTASIES